MTLFEDLYKNFGNLEATHQAVQQGAALPLTEDIYNHTRDELYALGAAKQKAVEEHNRKLEEKPASFFSAIGNFWQHDTATGVAAQKLMTGFQSEDPDFNVEKAVKEVSNEFTMESDIEVLKSAKNKDHFELLADNLRDYNEHRWNIERLGVPASLAAQLVAEFGNLINYVPFLNIASKGNRVLKTKDILKAAALQASVNTAEEKFIDTAYKDRTASDYIAAAAMGAGMAGGILSVSKAFSKTKGDAGKRIKDEADAFAMQRMKDAADEKIAERQGGPRPERDWTNAQDLRDAEGNLPKDIADKMEARGYDPNSDFDYWVNLYEEQNLIPQAKALPQEKFRLAGFAQTLARSENKYVRALNRALFEHGEGGLGVHKEHTAALEADLETHRLFGKYNEQFLQHKAAFGVEAEKLGMSMKDFDRVAYRYIDSDGSIGIDGKIKVPGDTSGVYKILDDFKDMYNTHTAELVDHVRKAGVKEADDFEKAGHLFRKYDPQQFLKLTQQYGDQAVKDLLHESIMRGKGFEASNARASQKVWDAYKEELDVYQNKLRRLENELETLQHKANTAKDFTKEIQAGAKVDKWIRKIEDLKKTEPVEPQYKEMDPERISRRIAEAIYNRFYNRAVDPDPGANLLHGSNRSLISDALEDLRADGKLAQEDADHIAILLGTKGQDKIADVTKHRIEMDMNATVGKGPNQLNMTDLLDVDMGSGYMSAGRYWIGRAALARKGDHLASDAAIEDTIRRTARAARKTGADGKQVESEIQLIRKGIKLITGRPIEDMSAPSQIAMRNIRKAVINSSLGKLGIIQASETGRMLAAVDSAMRFPMIKGLVKGIVTGKVDSAQLKEIEDFLVGDIGFRPYMNHPDFRADDFGHKIHPAEKFQDKMSYYLAKASGWNRVYTMQNKMLMNGLSQKWYREIMDGTFKETQMRDLGVDGVLLEDLRRNMKAHAKKTEGLSGEKTYTELGLENWDPATRRAFALMLHRKASNAVQMIQLGETPMWLNGGIGKFLGQLRSFTIGALSKQTTRDYKMLREGDLESAVAMTFNVATATMAQAVRVGFVAATLTNADERKEYLEQALNPVSVVNQILSYTGPLSPLMDATNIVGDTVFGDAWGEVAGGRYGFRQRGLASAAPGVAFVNKAYRGVSGGMAAMTTDKEFTKSDYRSLFGLLPFSNNYAFEALNNGLVSPNLFKEE